MLPILPPDDLLYQALIKRDASFEGRALVGVTSTGIFCRLSCTARKPKRENCRFYATPADCIAAGFRPCLRCKPLAPLGRADPIVADLMRALEAAPDRRWLESDIVARGLDPSTVRRQFKRHLGITFLDLARRYRLRQAAGALARGESVIDAQLEARFESPSGFRTAFARLLGHAPSELRADSLLVADWVASPIGPLLVVADRTSLHLVEFFDRKALPTELRRLEAGAKQRIGIGRTAVTERLEEELGRYFAGTLDAFATPLALNASAFTRSVWAALRAIPAGDTRSYSDIAAAIGCPTSVRAVARANGANQLAIVIPCHRVIGSDGDLTGYGGGLWRKRWLLDHERATAGGAHVDVAA